MQLSLALLSYMRLLKCMQEAYIAGTKDTYARMRAKIWLARSSHNTAQYKLESRSNECSILLDILENDTNCRAEYARHLLQNENIGVARKVQSNNDRIHVDAITYFYATFNPRNQDTAASFNPRNQDTAARDEMHLPSSAGVCDVPYDIKHRVHISARVTRVNISVYLDIVQAIRQHDLQLHPLITVSKTLPYRLREYDTETGGVCLHSIPGGRSEV